MRNGNRLLKGGSTHRPYTLRWTISPERRLLGEHFAASRRPACEWVLRTYIYAYMAAHLTILGTTTAGYIHKWTNSFYAQGSELSQRSFQFAPIFRLLLKVAVKGTHQCDYCIFWGEQSPTRYRQGFCATVGIGCHFLLAGVARLTPETTAPAKNLSRMREPLAGTKRRSSVRCKQYVQWPAMCTGRCNCCLCSMFCCQPDR